MSIPQDKLTSNYSCRQILIPSIQYDRKTPYKVLPKVIPLTLCPQKQDNLHLQIWKTDRYGMIGTVLDPDGNLKIIPKNRIFSAFNRSLKGDMLMERIEGISLRKWDLVYQVKSGELLVLPHLEAAGRFSSRDIWNTPFQNRDRDGVRALLREHGYVQIPNIPKEVWESKKWVCHIDYDTDGHPPHLDIYANKKREDIKEYNSKFGGKTPKYRFAIKPDGGEGPNKGGGSPPPNPAKGQFHENLQKTGLTKSFNSCHQDNPAPKGAGSGEIGGVGCTVELIEGLFDSPESLFETEHSFFIPEFEGQQIPFSSQEMCQIAQELARGIYIHGTVPFFSLHFNQDANLYPVIHPAYENTLVGQVFSMLDYFMKGYLNGGVFKESFIQKWQQNPYEIEVNDTILQELINFKSYAETHLPGKDKDYFCVRNLLKKMELNCLQEMQKAMVEGIIGALDKNYQKENPIFNDYTKFTNSFRIIAKQRDIGKTENLFVINSDFDVKYTIEPDPDYKKALEEYYKLHGSYPQAYMNLQYAYEMTAKNIHDHMVKMPFCKKYFAMLGVINFFSYYFMTLKKHHKFPIIPEVNPIKAQSPSLFPPLPLLTTRKEDLKVNIYDIIMSLIEQQKPILKQFLINQATPLQVTQLKNSIEKIFWEHIIRYASHPLKRQLLHDQQVSQNLCKKATELDLLNLIKSIFDNQMYVVWIDYIVENFLKKILPSDLKKNDLDKIIELASMTLDLFVLPSEQSTSEVELGKKIVGGCGMNLSSHKVQRSPIGHVILDTLWTTSQQTPFGEWSSITSNTPSTPKGAIFTLPFMDIPFGYLDNSQDMEMLLNSSENSNGSSLAQMFQIINSISQNKEKKFQGLINSTQLDKMVDREGRSLLHLSVMVENLFYTKELLTKGLSTETKDHKGYLPIHYAAMSGQIAQLKLLIKKDKKTIHATSNQGATPLIVAIQHGQHSVVSYLLAKGAWRMEIFKDRYNTDLDVGKERLKDGYTALHCAVHHGDLEFVQLFLRNLSNTLLINVATNEGVTPLMIACRLGSFPIANFLIKRGANPKVMAKNGTTALEIAVKKDHLELCQLLAPLCPLTPTTIEVAIKKSSLEINQILANLPGYMSYVNPLNETPLFMAIRYANIPLAMHIVGKIQDPMQINCKNRMGEFTVLLAIKGKFYPLVEALFQRGAKMTPFDLFKRLLRAGYQGQYPALNGHIDKSFTEEELNLLTLTAAKTGNHVGISKLLLPKGVDLSKVKQTNGWGIDQYLAKSDGIFLFKLRYQKTKNLLQPLNQEDGKTLAYIAAENGSHRVLEFLIDQMKISGSSFKNHYKGRDLLYAMLERDDLGGFRLLNEKMEDPQMVNRPIDDANTYPVHLAAKHCSVSILEYLHSCGANFNVVDAQGHYPLFYAIQREKEDLIEFLIRDHHLNPVTADSLYLAASFINHKIFENLLKNGGNIDNQSNPERNSALFLAIKKHDKGAFLQLIQNKASFTVQNREGWTPFLLAVQEGQVEMVDTISSIDPTTAKNTVNGNNGLHIACQEGHEHCAELLMSKGFSPEKPNALGQTAFFLAKDNHALKAIFNPQPKNESYYTHLTEELYQAIKKQNLSSILKLLQTWPINSYFSINIGGMSFRGTILHLCLELCGKCDGIEILISEIVRKKEFNTRLKDSNGNSYAHLMVDNEINPLPFKMFDLEAINQEGNTPLHHAAKENNLACLTTLVEALGPLKCNPVNLKGKTPLFFAIQSNRQQNVKILSQKGANLEHSDYLGFTPLIMACQMGNYPIIRTLIKYGANINQKGTDGLTPLAASFASKSEDAPLFLLFNGAKINSVNIDGLLIGHLAASLGKIYILRFLAEQGISLSSLDGEGLQPIHHAALANKPKALQFFSSQGISIETPIVETRNKNKKNEIMTGMTPILLASMQGTTETVKWLLDHKANPEKQTFAGLNILQSTINNSPGNCQEIIRLFNEYLLITDLKQLLPAISMAIAKDYIEPLKLLYKMGVPLYAKLDGGLTGLHYACQYGALSTTEFLLTHGAEWKVLAESGESPLELAASNKSSEQFQLMLNFTNPPLDQQNSKGETLMHIAVRAGNIAHVIALIDRGADFDIQDFQGNTPLHIAAETGNKEIIKLLMICEANPNLKTLFNSLMPEDAGNPEIKDLFMKLGLLKKLSPLDSTPLHIAARACHPLSLRLTSRHFDVHKKNCLGRTALHDAVSQGSLEIIRILIEAGANVREKDQKGMTPLDIANSEAPNQAIAKFLSMTTKLIVN